MIALPVAIKEVEGEGEEAMMIAEEELPEEEEIIILFLVERLRLCNVRGKLVVKIAVIVPYVNTKYTFYRSRSGGRY